MPQTRKIRARGQEFSHEDKKQHGKFSWQLSGWLGCESKILLRNGIQMILVQLVSVQLTSLLHKSLHFYYIQHFGTSNNHFTLGESEYTLFESVLLQGKQKDTAIFSEGHQSPCHCSQWELAGTHLSDPLQRISGKISLKMTFSCRCSIIWNNEMLQ